MPIIYLDIETDNSEGYNGLDVFGGRIVTIQLLMPNGKTRIIKDPTLEQMNKIKPILEENLICGHNLKFDSKFLKQKFGITLYNVYDTYIAEIVLSGGMYAKFTYYNSLGICLGLKDKEVKGKIFKGIISRYCGAQIGKEEQTGFKYGEPLTAEQIEYAANDLKYLPDIYKQQQAKIKLMGIEKTIEIEMKCLPAMVWLELSGFKIDLNKVVIIEKKLNLIVASTEKYLIPRMTPHFNKPIKLSSPTQMVQVLTNMGYDLPLKKDKKGMWKKSTDEDSLNKFKGDKLIQMFLKYKYATKFLTSSVYPTRDKIVAKKPVKGCVYPDGRTYTNFKQCGTETGRLAGAGNGKDLPIQCLNFQTQPKKLGWRDVFVPEVGHKLIVSDFSQIEPRIMAQVSGDPKMIEAYATGKDLYLLTACAIFGIPYDLKKYKKSKEREISKQITLGLCYGLGTPGLIKKLKTEYNINITIDEAKRYINKFKKTYPVVTAFLNKTGSDAIKTGMARNVCGRVRKFPSVKQGDEWHISNAAMNAVIQSLSADITKIAMGNLFLILEPMRARFCTTVHDEVVIEAPDEIAEKVKGIVEDEMIKAGKLFLIDVPCTVECDIHTEWKK